MIQNNNQIKPDTQSLQTTVVCRYYHPCVGYGDFVLEYNGRYGSELIIKLDNGTQLLSKSYFTIL